MTPHVECGGRGAKRRRRRFAVVPAFPKAAWRSLPAALHMGGLAVLLFVTALQAAPSASLSANIVLIVADDMGWNAVGWHNRDVRTPHLDRLCREGVELDAFYVSPMCSPTRAGLMTGRYPIRFGCARAVIPPWRDYGLPVDETTLAEALATAGYERRGVFGKWHLGHARAKWRPNQRGFTDYMGCLNGAIDYFTHEREGEIDWHRDNDPLKQEGYSTTQIGQAASAFIREAAEEDAPYFCYVPFNAPHSPFQVPDADLARYPDEAGKRKRTYLAMISVMDDEIGQILKAVEDSGESDNTLVWFFSDNGGVGTIAENNAPLKGSKLTTYEGGIRVPACVRFPAAFPPGKRITERTAYIDVMPTLMALAGLDPETAHNPLDGVDIGPLLSGKTDHLPDRDLYAYHGQGGEDQEWMAVISDGWKLVVHGPRMTESDVEGRRIELYHLADDPNEQNNLAEREPDRVLQLAKRLTAFRNLQPESGIPPYAEGRDGFVAPRDWGVTFQE